MKTTKGQRWQKSGQRFQQCQSTCYPAPAQCRTSSSRSRRNPAALLPLSLPGCQGEQANYVTGKGKGGWVEFNEWGLRLLNSLSMHCSQSCCENREEGPVQQPCALKQDFLLGHFPNSRNWKRLNNCKILSRLYLFFVITGCLQSVPSYQKWTHLDKCTQRMRAHQVLRATE